MAFEQLYYTSCERGVGGYAGFQFNAVSPGAGERTMRAVEQLTVYELPSWDSSHADAPVNLCHVRDAARGDSITANVVYAGTDFSGRSGNYFAHALVTADPEQDFDGLLPVELWESPVWARTPVDGTTLPALAGALPRGSVDRPAVAAFVEARGDARKVLARLLSAVDKVMREDRSLILWTANSTENAYWIAAVSYLMEASRAREMSFYTYTRRPAQCRAHVVGTVPGTVTSAAVLADSFRVFDLTARTLPEVEVHPLAELLVQVGVVHAAGLWRQAALLATGTERTLDDWYPVAAAAAGLLGVEPLPSGAVDSIAGWLHDASVRPDPLSGPRVETVLTVLHDRYAELGDDRLRPLLSAANAAGAVGQLQRIETILVDRALIQLEHGRPPGGPILLASQEVQQLAVTGCERLLRTANADAAMAVLDWARQSQLSLDAELVERCGRAVIGPALPSLAGDRRLLWTGQAYPELAAGLGDYLATLDMEAAGMLMEGIAGELLRSSDLSGNPRVREIVLTEEVRFGRLAPVTALREVIQLRSSPASALSDDYLLARLWPQGLSTPGEAAAMLPLLVGDVRQTPALALLDRALQRPRRLYDVDAWLQLCAAIHGHRVFAQLPSATRQLVDELQGLGELLGYARLHLADSDMPWYADLHDRIEGLPPVTRDLLRQSLADLTLAMPRPAQQLAQCSRPVLDVACERARNRLGIKPYDRPLAARLFQSVRELHGSPGRARQIESEVLGRTVLSWPRRDQREVAALLKWQGRRASLLRSLIRPDSVLVRDKRRPDLSADFLLWCENGAWAGSSDFKALASGRSIFQRIRGRRRPGRE